jgi:hypothetical protein
MNCIFCTMKLYKRIDLNGALRLYLAKSGEEIHAVAAVPRCQEHADIPVIAETVKANAVSSTPRLYDDAMKLFDNPLLLSEAKFIKTLRVDMECTTARISELLEQHQMFSHLVLGACHGDRGRRICELAAERLGEDPVGLQWEL